jgi:hypothetical protein
MVIVTGVAMFVGLARALMLGLGSVRERGGATTERLLIAVVALVLPWRGCS